MMGYGGGLKCCTEEREIVCECVCVLYMCDEWRDMGFFGYLWQKGRCIICALLVVAQTALCVCARLRVSVCVRGLASPPFSYCCFRSVT